ncbi:Gamma-glutamyltranspeptidase 1 [Hypsibius exemplaris]|uniref:Gamma-glutamyltranspeptidase 1 n=1 Tax=Hypsibius exemplaris TaxID=2072580 RepID=A0A1W0WJP1_HYPEX|nr:Gamma-glutamyltranspeptidase 1 [Hypsibius exemplaris]
MPAVDDVHHDKSASKVTLVSSISGSTADGGMINNGSSKWTSSARASTHPHPGSRPMPRTKRLIVAGSISLLLFLLIITTILATYYGIAATRHPGHTQQPNTTNTTSHESGDAKFPGSSEWTAGPSGSVKATYQRQSVASDAAECSKAGNKILERGGSAVDAAITTALCAGLYHPHSCGIGGGFFMVVYDRALKNAHSIDAREVAPAAATERMYVDNKNISSLRGWHAIAVPGEIYGYWEAFKRFGSGNLTWKQLFEPAIALAEQGLVVNQVLAAAISSPFIDIRGFDAGLTDIFVNKATGQPFIEGEIIRYPMLAHTLRMIADDEQGIFEYYQGKIAQNLASDIQEGGGILTLEDLNNYRPVIEDALHSKLRDNSSMYGVPPPAGSLVLHYIISIMDGYNYNQSWDSMSDDDKILFYHRFTEAMKFAYARRTELADRRFVPEVAEMKETLLSPWFAKLTRALINDQHTSNDTKTYGVNIAPAIGKVGTSHISIIDKLGNAVSITTTINTRFGSWRVSKKTGIILNNEMDDFTADLQLPNFYGLPPSQANRIAPGKRPQSSCAPIIVADHNGDVRAVMGASGGSRIISSIANALIRVLYLGQDVKEAIDAPRLHHQLLPMELNYEPKFLRKHLKGLENKGHRLVSNPSAIGVFAIINSPHLLLGLVNIHHSIRIQKVNLQVLLRKKKELSDCLQKTTAASSAMVAADDDLQGILQAFQWLEQWVGLALEMDTTTGSGGGGVADLSPTVLDMTQLRQLRATQSRNGISGDTASGDVITLVSGDGQQFCTNLHAADLECLVQYTVMALLRHRSPNKVPLLNDPLLGWHLHAPHEGSAGTQINMEARASIIRDELRELCGDMTLTPVFADPYITGNGSLLQELQSVCSDLGYSTDKDAEVPEEDEERTKLSKKKQASRSSHPLFASASRTKSKKKIREDNSKLRRCRGIYGITQQNKWCNMCKWKKACSRFTGSMSEPEDHFSDFSDLSSSPPSIRTVSSPAKKPSHDLKSFSLPKALPPPLKHPKSHTAGERPTPQTCPAQRPSPQSFGKSFAGKKRPASPSSHTDSPSLKTRKRPSPKTKKAHPPSTANTKRVIPASVVRSPLHYRRHHHQVAFFPGFIITEMDLLDMPPPCNAALALEAMRGS